MTGPSTLAVPGDRGRLVIKDRVVATIAERAAAEVPSVVVSSSSLNPLSRRLPRADVTVTPTHARLTLHIASAYDRPLYAVAADVRGRVTETVTRLTGMTVDIANVEIGAVEPAPPETDERTADLTSSTLARKDPP